jgi:hypothetical protein
MYFTKISIYTPQISEIIVIDENNEIITLNNKKNDCFRFFISHPILSKSIIKIKFIFQNKEYEDTITLHSKFYNSNKEFQLCLNDYDYKNIFFQLLEC